MLQGLGIFILGWLLVQLAFGLWFLRHWPRPADYIIGPADNPQVLRWWVIPRNPFFNIYLHKFCRSDDDRALHDHPWCNMSFLLKGEYFEVMPAFKFLPPHSGNLRGVGRRPFRPVFRFAKSPHRVMLYGRAGQPLPCWSLFFTGPNLRTWGFYCPQGWVPWHQFIERYEGGNERGKGCD